MYNMANTNTILVPRQTLVAWLYMVVLGQFLS
jgi:hypothetical protein